MRRATHSCQHRGDPLVGKPAEGGWWVKARAEAAPEVAGAAPRGEASGERRFRYLLTKTEGRDVACRWEEAAGVRVLRPAEEEPEPEPPGL